MNFFYEVLSVVFVSVGAVIGAGFISGRELVAFFGTENCLIPLLISTALIIFSFSLLYLSGKIHGGLKNLNRALFDRPFMFDGAVLISSFISVSCMLAGLDSLFLSLTGVAFPLLSLSVLSVVSFTSKYGIKGVEKTSVFLIPVILIITDVLIVKRTSRNFTLTCGFNTSGFISAVLYAFMNVFINLPAIVDTATGKSKKALVVSAVFSGLILLVESLFILSAVKGGKCEDAEMPLFNAVGKNSLLFSLALFCAMLSSVISAYYPLYNFANAKKGKVGIVFLAVSCFVFSRLGIKVIIDCVYPVIGAFGVLYIAKCVLFKIKKERYKKSQYDDNNIKNIDGGNYVK